MRLQFLSFANFVTNGLILKFLNSTKVILRDLNLDWLEWLQSA
jgi:hypothetical protein